MGQTESGNNRDWAHGRKHIFLSEGARQQLETLRIDIKNKSATRIQAAFRGYLIRRKITKKATVRNTNLNLMVQPTGRPSGRPKPISCTPPPFEGQHQQQPQQTDESCNNQTDGQVFLNRGETVIVIGNSQRRGYLVVEKHNHTMHVPHYYMELKRL